MQQLQHSLHNGLLGGGLLAAFRFSLATFGFGLTAFLAKIADQFGEHILRRIRALVRLRYGRRHLLLRRIRALVRLRYGRRRLSLRFNRLLLRFSQLLSRFNHQLVRFLTPLGQFFAGVIRILARFGQPFLGVLARFLFPVQHIAHHIPVVASFDSDGGETGAARFKQNVHIDVLGDNAGVAQACLGRRRDAWRPGKVPYRPDESRREHAQRKSAPPVDQSPPPAFRSALEHKPLPLPYDSRNSSTAFCACRRLCACR